MKTNRLSYIQNILVPCLVFSAAAGVFTGILIFLFKAAVSWVAAHSEIVYEAVHTNPVRIPVLIAGMLFAFEEAHRRISPMLIMTASMTALTGTATMRLLCLLTDVPFHLFHFSADAVLPLSYLWCAVLRRY